MLAKSVSEAARFVAERGLIEEGAPIVVRFISQVASRFGVVLTQKFAAQALPLVGALGGASVNYLFIEHFQETAQSHFTVRRLERAYGKDIVRAEDERLVQNHWGPAFSPLQDLGGGPCYATDGWPTWPEVWRATHRLENENEESSRYIGLIMLAKVRAALRSLDRLRRIVKVLSMVNSPEGFGDQPRVVNGFSDLMVEVFGEQIGKHARSAVGMQALPSNSAVEVEMIVEVEWAGCV
jgi:hypothetical protein